MLQRPPSGRQKHNASDPMVFNLLGFWVFWLFSFFFFSSPSVCMHLSVLSFLLHPSPWAHCHFTDICSIQASSIHWSLSCFLALRSQENICSCPDLTTHQLEEPWRTFFPFHSAAAQWEPPTRSWSLTHRLTLASNKKFAFLPNESYTRKQSISRRCIPGTLKFTCLTRCHQCHL